MANCEAVASRLPWHSWLDISRYITYQPAIKPQKTENTHLHIKFVKNCNQKRVYVKVSLC
jgi:hypothetical protein